MRLFSIYFLTALVLGGLVAWLVPARSVDQQLLHIQLEQVDPSLSHQVADAAPALQALLLSYAQDPVLLAEARVALLRYPTIAEPVLLAYGEQPLFQQVLSRYGNGVVLPIQYFRDNELQSLIVRHAIESQVQGLVEKWQQWFGQKVPAESPDSTSTREPKPALSADERGRYAILFLEDEGYDFLGQFVVNGAGKVEWVQTERVLEGVTSLLAGGVRDLETRWLKDETIRPSDWGWAAADVAVMASAFKLLRMGRAATATGRTMSSAQKSAVVAAPLWRSSALGLQLAKYGATAVMVYVAIKYPSVLNASFARVAELLHLPPAVGQWIGWTIVAMPVLWVLGLLLPLLSLLFKTGSGVCLLLSRMLYPRRVKTDSSPA